MGGKDAFWGLSLSACVAACGSPAEQDFFASGSAGGKGSTSPSGGSAGSAGSSAGSGGSAGGSTGGSSGAGAGGKGGSGSMGGPDDLIDDMEDGDRVVLEAGNRDGVWYSFGDETNGGYLQPAQNTDFTMGYTDPARSGSTRAARLLGGNFQDWGAALAVNFRTNDQSYDLTTYGGLRFFARSNQGPLEIGVAIPDRNSSQFGGVCGDGKPTACFNHPRATVTLSQEWKEYRVDFDQLGREGSGSSAIDLTATYSVFFTVAAGGTFDFWVDDLALTR